MPENVQMTASELGQAAHAELMTLAEYCPPEMQTELEHYLNAIEALLGLLENWHKRAVKYHRRRN